MAKRGRPEIEITSEQIKQIETMAGIGLTIPQIAAVLGISETTLERKHRIDPLIKEAILKGRALASSQVMKSAFQQAVSGKSAVMTIFWLKCREHWKETTVHELTGKDGAPIETSQEGDKERKERLQRIKLYQDIIKETDESGG